MKRLFLLAAVLASPVAAQSSHTVQGHVRSDGTYVQPHQQTNPNSTKNDNWSTQGNYNPTTGRAGTVDPYKPTQSNPFGSPENKPRRSNGGF